MIAVRADDAPRVIGLFDEPVTTLGTVTDAPELRIVASDTRINLTVEQLRAAWQTGLWG